MIVVFNKADQGQPSAETTRRLEAEEIPFLSAVASQGEGVLDLRAALIRSVPDEFLNPPSILGDLIAPGQGVMLVVPIDKEAPKGIPPEVPMTSLCES